MGGAQQEVILAMVGRHVDQPGARVRGDEVAGKERAGFREEAAEVVHGVAGDGAGEFSATISCTPIYLSVTEADANLYEVGLRSGEVGDVNLVSAGI